MIWMMCHPLALSCQGALTLGSPSNCVFSKINTHFHPMLSNAQTSEFGCTEKKRRVIFDPANSGISVLPSPLEVQGRECNLWSKARWAHWICTFSSKKCHKILTFYCAIIPIAATNTQQSTENEGGIKAIGGDWFFHCCKKITARIGQQRKEESYFLYAMKKT